MEDHFSSCPGGVMTIKGTDCRVRTSQFHNQNATLNGNNATVPSVKTVFEGSSIGPPNQCVGMNHVAKSQTLTPVFHCEYEGCQQTFHEQHLLWFHLRNHIPRESRLLCSYCPYVDIDRHRLDDHKQSCHFSPDALTCQVCGYLCHDRLDLSRHMFQAHMQGKRFAYQPHIK